MATASFDKVLQVLDIVENASSGLSFDDIHAQLDAPRSTLYRYLKALADAGLIVSLPATGYTLGPRIAELDYKMRSSDPLIVSSKPVMAELVQAVPAVALLCRLYRDKVLCVHQEQNAGAPRSGYERGRARPLFRGAASRAILAYLPPRTIAKLFSDQAANAGELGAPERSLDELKLNLQRIRQRGWAHVEGQVTPGATGISAPIFEGGARVIASLSLTITRTSIAPQELNRIGERVAFCAGIITKAIEQRISA